MTSSLLKKTIVAFVAIAVLASGTAAFAQTFFSRSDRVLGFDTDVWRVWVPAGSNRVVVAAGSHTDIDLEVVDETTGRLLAVDNDGTSYCIGDIYMPYAGYIQIRIDNLGRFSNGYNVHVRSR
jgi:hypothetical protein